jgi:hypothetical protein
MNDGGRTLSGRELAAVNQLAMRLSPGTGPGERQARSGLVLTLLVNLRSDILTAEVFARQKWGDAEMHNGRGDALKHCYLSALLTSHFNEKFALDFMTAHEEVPGNPVLEMGMDLHNNGIGRAIARNHQDIDDSQLGELCNQAVLNGITWVIEGDGTNWPSDELGGGSSSDDRQG